MKRILKLIWIASIIVIFTSCSVDSCTLNSDPLLQQVSTYNNWRIFKNRPSRSLGEITTYTTNGLVIDYLDIVLASDTMLAAGSTMNGVSYILLEDIGNPKGKVKSYTGPNTGIASDRFGFSGLAIHPVTNKMYAWYNREIVDLEELKPIYFNAPDYTHGTYGTTPITRFVIDEQGDFWIGTSNLRPDGSRRDGDENGLYRITVTEESSKKIEIFDYAVWHLYKDKVNNLWASTDNGFYKINFKTNEFEKFELKSDSWNECFIEQVIEYKGKLYAIAKNYFHNVHIDTQYALYEIDKGQKKLEHISDITKKNETHYHQTRAFVYKDTLYFVLGGSLKKLDAGNKIVETSLIQSGHVNIGQYSHSVVNDTLYSVGNRKGISIFNDAGHTILTQAATAEGLVSDSIFTIHVSPDQETVYVGPYLSGTVSRFRGETITNFLFEDEVSISSFFDRGGDTYVVGTGLVGKLTEDDISTVVRFSTNGDRTNFDPSGYLWAYPGSGSGGNGLIGMINLETYEIKRTKEDNGYDYFHDCGNESDDFSLFWDSQFDQRYRFNHVIPIPGSADVMIAISEGVGEFKTNPYTLRYSYEDNTFTKVPITDQSSEGIMYMGSDGTTLYGLGRQKVFELEEEGWVEKYSIRIGNDFRDMVIVEDYAIIASGWSSDGPGAGNGFEILNLNSNESKFYTTQNTPLPSDSVFAVAAQKVGLSKYRIWFGTNDGLAYCTVDLP